MILFKILTFKNEINIQQKNSTFNINSLFNKKINIQLVNSASNKNYMFNKRIEYLMKIFDKIKMQF